MAIKGLSIPVCGTYKKEEDRVSYEEPFVADHAVEYGVSWGTMRPCTGTTRPSRMPEGPLRAES